MTPQAEHLRLARLLWDYLRLGVPARPAECLLVLGGHDIGVAARAAELHAQGTAPLIVVSGGSRAVPDGSYSPTEADAIAHALLSRGVPKEAIAIERLASNTSENFWLSAELLRDLGLDPATFLTVTKPYAERRTIATARRRWPRRNVTEVDPHDRLWLWRGEARDRSGELSRFRRGAVRTTWVGGWARCCLIFAVVNKDFTGL